MEIIKEVPSPARVTPDAKKLLNGQSPHQRGQEKQRIVCRWVYYHGATTAEIINLVSGQKAPGYAKKLVDKGLLVASQTISGSPKFFYTLSKAGLNLASEFSPTPVEYKCLSPSKLSQTLFDHNFAVQKISLTVKKSHGFKYQSQAQLALRHAVGSKIPDAVWQDENGRSIAVEVEFSQKHGRPLDMMIRAMKDSLEKKEYSCYFIFARSETIIKNYSKAISKGEVTDFWVKNKNGNWTIEEEKREKVPDWLSEKVFFFNIEKSFINPLKIDFDL